jgi:hypothetical protein
MPNIKQNKNYKNATHISSQKVFKYSLLLMAYCFVLTPTIFGSGSSLFTAIAQGSSDEAHRLLALDSIDNINYSTDTGVTV